MKSAYVYLPVWLNDFKRENAFGFSGDFYTLIKAAEKLCAIGIKGILFSPMFECLEAYGPCPYMPKTFGLETALISAELLIDEFGKLVPKVEKSKSANDQFASIYYKRKCIRLLLEELKKNLKNSPEGQSIYNEFRVYRKEKYSELRTSAFVSELPRYFANLRINKGKDAEYLTIRNRYMDVPEKDFDVHYLTGTQYTWPEEIFTIPSVCAYYEAQIAESIDLYLFSQFIAERQFKFFMSELAKLDMKAMIDIPIGVAEDSSYVLEDRLKEKDAYHLDRGLARYTIGVRGQSWGIIAMKNTEDARESILKRYSKFYNLSVREFRVDAALQLIVSWIIPRSFGDGEAHEQKFDSMKFFAELRRRFRDAFFMAEDLGDGPVPEEMRDIQRKFDIAGMGILEYMDSCNFGNTLRYLQSQAINCVVHTSNHDTKCLVKLAKQRGENDIRHFVMHNIWRVLECSAERVILNILDIMLLDKDFNTFDSSRWTDKFNVDEMDYEICTWLTDKALRESGRKF